MLQGEHSAILLTFVKLPFIIKIFVLSILSGRSTQVLLYTHCLNARADLPHLPSHLTYVRFLMTWHLIIDKHINGYSPNTLFYLIQFLFQGFVMCTFVERKALNRNNFP